MANRNWALPDIQDLSKEQERARLLPTDGCHLIIGGPGTGKSVLALLRSRRHHRPKGGQDYVFLVYNKLLLQASRELVGGAVNAYPWKKWFKGVVAQALQVACPTTGQPYDLDWARIKDSIEIAPEIPRPSTRYVVIDEGQDMPPAFYRALVQLGFENFYVVADENQQITDENSSLHDIETELDIATQDRIELSENYRNCDRVARLALSFYVDNPASPAVKVPQGRPCPRTPLLVDYGSGCRWGFDDVIRRVLKLSDRDPQKLIGIITPNNRTRERWFTALTQFPVALDHSRPQIATYASGAMDDGSLRFGEGGIFVINAQSSKGLEFDTVLLADIHEYPGNLHSADLMDAKRRLFYVMVSRAREQVILLRESGRPCPIEGILPQDESILRRRS